MAAPAPSGDTGRLLPLTSLQRSMLLASMGAPRSGMYLVQDVVELGEDVDAGLLRRAWRIVAQRHPALRRAVELEDSAPAWLRLQEDPEIHWRELDWTGMSSEEQKARLESFVRQDRESGFHDWNGVPMRFAVLRTSSNSCTLIWSWHHALLDGRSCTIVWREWFEAYEALLRGGDVALVEPAADDADPFPPPDSKRTEQFWRNSFEGLQTTTDYLVDRILRASTSPAEEVGRETATLSQDSTQALRDFAAGHGVTVNTLVQGAWALLLSRYSGRSDVIFGVTRACRGWASNEASNDASKVGFFMNTLPLRVAVPSDSQLLPWLKQLRAHWTEMREFERTPLDRIVKWSGLPAGMPPFESVLAFEHAPVAESLRKPLRRLQRTDSPLTLAAFGSPLLTLEIVYDTRLFCARTIAAASLHLTTLLESFVAQPDARLAELNMLTESETRWLFDENERQPAAYPVDLCAHQLFERAAERTPHAVALDGPDGALSYRELNRRANQLAWHLRERGASPEDLVAIRMAASAEAVIAILGVLKAGAAFLPLDPTLPEARLRAMLAHARPKLVLGGDRERLAGQPAENPPNAATPDNPAYAIYTSGSTGEPKAVVIPHRALVNHTLGAVSVFGIRETDRRLQFVSIGSDVFVAEVFNYLSSGAALVFGWGRAGSVREFLRCLDERRITMTGIPAAWWNEWVASLPMKEFAPPRSLRTVTVGMEKLNPDALRTWKNTVGKEIRLFNAYGPTETCPTATAYETGSSEWEEGTAVPIGTPLPNTSAWVLDPDGNLVPVGVAGELHIGGAGVARGYLNSPEPTSRSFLPDRFTGDPKSRLYKTGDVVFRHPDGNLVFLGRADRQVKIRGFRVELEEIEAALAGHPAVLQCAVVPRGERELVAFLTLRGAKKPAAGSLRSFLSQRLPEYMLPSEFMILARMPMTANGKIDRQSLPNRVGASARARAERVRPRGKTERRLAALWKVLLGISRVGAADNFFELGADSLTATRLITLIHAHFGREIPLALLWRAPTLARMAALLDGGFPDKSLDKASESILPLQPNGGRVPLFFISALPNEPLCFTRLPRHLGNEQPLFVLPNPIRQTGEHQSVEDLGSRACHAIRGISPQGPYVLGGYCFGGVVAFETARQLLASGDDVRLVVLFETPAPNNPQLFPRSAGQAWTTAKLASEAEGVVRFIAAKLRVEPRFRYIARAARAYKVAPTSIPVVQIVSAGSRLSTWVIEDPRLAWRKFCQGGFQVHRTPGFHSTMLREPHAAKLGELLTVLLLEFGGAK
jgi:amino acid adenylation domain-containing protein